MLCENSIIGKIRLEPPGCVVEPTYHRTASAAGSPNSISRGLYRFVAGSDRLLAWPGELQDHRRQESPWGIGRQCLQGKGIRRGARSERRNVVRLYLRQNL